MKRAIILGGTYPHRHLIEKLKERGYFTILVDYLESPIAKDVADKHIQESTLDMDKVADIAKEEGASLVISTCVDQANVTCCYVSEKLGLPHPYSYKASINVTDKVAMKRIMVDNDIPTSRHYVITDVDQFAEKKLSYPIIVKPADSNSSKGVRRIDEGDENALDYIKKALEISRNGAAVIEEYKVGKEVGVDCMIKDHKAHVIMTRERRKIQSNNDSIQQIYGSFWPADITPFQKGALQKIAEKIAEAFELDNTPLMMQTIVSDKEINVIEFGARIGGGENYHIIHELTGYDIINQSINSFLGDEIDLTYREPQEYLADNYIYAEPKVFGRMEIKQNVIGKVLYANVYRKKGALLGKDISSNNRVGVFVVKDKSTVGLLEKISDVINAMEVYDIDGNPIMRKDIY